MVGQTIQTGILHFDYSTAVDIPSQVESMSHEEAQRLRREAEANSRPLLLAIEAYRTSVGAYPPTVDPSALAGFLQPPAWPVNPFTGDRLRQSPDSPGDYDYRPKNNGADYEIQLWDWDGSYLFFDSVRAGGPLQPRPSPPSGP